MTNATAGRETRAKRNRGDRILRREMHMRVTIKNLDQVKEITGSDRVTAMILGVAAGKLSNVRKLRYPLPPMATLKLARMLKQPLFPALALALSATAKSSSSRNFWLDVATGRWPRG